MGGESGIRDRLLADTSHGRLNEVSRNLGAIRELYDIYLRHGEQINLVAEQVGMSSEQVDSFLRRGNDWGLFRYRPRPGGVGIAVRDTGMPKKKTVSSAMRIPDKAADDLLAEKARCFAAVCGGYEEAGEYLGYTPTTVRNLVCGGPVGRHAKADIAQMLANDDFATNPGKYPKNGFIRIRQPIKQDPLQEERAELPRQTSEEVAA